MDLTALLQPISADVPSGENLEYDPLFAEMEAAAQPKAEQQYGATIIEGKEPEWLDVRRAALELLGRTRDLRIAAYLARAALHTDGLAGFRDGLQLLRGYVETFWSSVHPQLDPDDDDDPTMRVNTLAGLCDLSGVLTPLRKTPIVSVRTVGQFSRFDVGVAAGEFPYSGPPDEKPKPALIDAAFQECPVDQLRSMTEAATQAVEHVRGIESAVTRQVGAGNMRSLESLVKELEAIRKILADRLSRRAGAVAEAPVAEIAPEAAPAETNGAAPSGKPAGARWSGEITSRDEAIRAISDVCRYFERYEPSSPLPLLLHRAVRLSTKSFLEILRDISPDGLSQAESLGGMSSDEYMQLAAAAAAAAAPPAKAAPAAPAAPSPPPRPAPAVNNDY